MSLLRNLVLIAVWLAIPAATPVRADVPLSVQVRLHWNYDEFAKLEDLATRFRSTGEIDRDGVPKLTQFYRVFAELLSIELNVGKVHDPDALDTWQIVERWKHAIPNSPTVPIIEAIKIVEWVRDPRIAGSYIQEAGYQPARNAVAEAIIRLEGVGGDPHALTVKAQLLCLANVMEEDLILLADEAARLHPRYTATFEALLVCLTRRNFDNRKKQFILANSLASSVAKHGGNGDETYARMYLAVSKSGFGDRIFTATGVEWSRFNAGLRRIVERYPIRENVERLVLNACLAGDRSTTREFLAQIDDKPTRALWGNLKKYEDCEQWAKGDYQFRSNK